MYKTLIVVDHDNPLPARFASDVVSFEQYLNEYPKLNEPRTRVINLCDTEQYLSRGYYCSLLAEARRHEVLPTVKTINALRSADMQASLPAELLGQLQQALAANAGQRLLFFFGNSGCGTWDAIGRALFARYGAPLLCVEEDAAPAGLRIQRVALSALDTAQYAQFLERLDLFTRQVWRIGIKSKCHRWEMAILVNPDEPNPPSNREALSRFVKAAAKQGIGAELVRVDQVQQIDRYDALFLRETTAIDHASYRLACQAEQRGLVVMDDPSSILRCCNKVFLHDAFSYQKVPSLRSEVISDLAPETLDRLEAQFGYPLVLKMPEGSFSRGVFKVQDRAELVQQLSELFRFSALVLAQEYLYTDFDWRIGILGGRAIYACRYLMARNHWQIYNHGAKRFNSGGFETLPTFEVPRPVLDAALKAARVVGNGLYGVDVKEVGRRAYVLEVNDNPSIDHRIEDAYLGDELYMQIMAEFQRRLEARGRA